MKQITLTQGKVALVDDADFESLNQFKWHAAKIGGVFYALRYARDLKQHVRMHIELLGYKGIDHIDGNGLNNQRSNLRPASVAQNNRNVGLRRDNRSGFKGVSFHKHNQKWRAYIAFQRWIHIGYFSTAAEAAHAYDIAAKKYFGTFARLNFPKHHEPNHNS